MTSCSESKKITEFVEILAPDDARVYTMLVYPGSQIVGKTKTTAWEKREEAWVEASTQAPTHFSHAFFSLSLLSGGLEQASLTLARTTTQSSMQTQQNKLK